MATITLSPTLTPVLERVSPASQGIDETCLARLYARIEAHIAAGWYPGAAIAMARHGKLSGQRSFGVARLADRQHSGGAGDGPDHVAALLANETGHVVCHLDPR